MNRLLGVACSLVCLAGLGCGGDGPELGSVTGKVTLDGKPVTNAVVTFVPQQGGRPATGRTDATGQYKLVFASGQGALIGKHQVMVTTVPEVKASGAAAASGSPGHDEQAAGQAQSPDNPVPVKDPIPAKYNTATELTFEVKSGDNVFDITMTSGAAPAAK